jgi:hypothetical protein
MLEFVTLTLAEVPVSVHTVASGFIVHGAPPWLAVTVPLTVVVPLTDTVPDTG